MSSSQGSGAPLRPGGAGGGAVPAAAGAAAGGGATRDLVHLVKLFEAILQQAATTLSNPRAAEANPAAEMKEAFPDSEELVVVSPHQVGGHAPDHPSDSPERTAQTLEVFSRCWWVQRQLIGMPILAPLGLSHTVKSIDRRLLRLETIAKKSAERKKTGPNISGAAGAAGVAAAQASLSSAL